MGKVTGATSNGVAVNVVGVGSCSLRGKDLRPTKKQGDGAAGRSSAQPPAKRARGEQPPAKRARGAKTARQASTRELDSASSDDEAPAKRARGSSDDRRAATGGADTEMVDAPRAAAADGDLPRTTEMVDDPPVAAADATPQPRLSSPDVEEPSLAIFGS